MWQIVGYVLVIVYFLAVLFGRIAPTRRASSLFSYLGMALFPVALLLSLWVDSSSALWTALGFCLASAVLAELIARPILKKRVMPPCVRVKGFSHSAVGLLIILLLLIPLFLFLLVVEKGFRHDLMMISGLVAGIGYLMLLLRQKTEICGNGVWQDGTLYPWQAYASFSWIMKDTVELRLASRSPLLLTHSIKLTVPPEDREAVQRLLESNLLDSRAITINA